MTVALPTTIEGVDLNAEVPCVIKVHDHRADVLVQSTCCRQQGTYGVCWSRYAASRARSVPVRCRHCGWVGLERDVIRIVEVLR